MVSSSSSIATMAVSLFFIAVCEISSVKQWRDFENWVTRVVQGHWRWRRCIEHIRLGRPLYVLSIALSWLETLNFFHTPSHSSSTPSSFAIGILPYRLVQKNCRIAWLTARWLKSLMISFRQNTGVWQTDRRIDRKTDRQTVRAMHTRRAVKTVANVFALFFHNRTRSLRWDGVNRFCKKSFVYSRLKRVTKRWEVRRKTNLDQCQSICNVTVAKMMYFCWK